MFENPAAYLILENGMKFRGRAFGRLREAAGEIVFLLGAGGYQEAVTDPAYAGQIVVMTYPLVGNYGFNIDDMESDSPKLSGLIVREKCDMPNNWRCEMDIDGFFKQHNLIGVEDIDTRELSKVIRDNGSMKAVIKFSENDEPDFGFSNKNAVESVTLNEKYTIDGPTGKARKIAVLDLGVKNSQLKEFRDRGAKITVYPASTPAVEILADNPEGVFISSGPGNPDDIPEIARAVKVLCEAKPTLGVGLGSLVIAKAFGSTVKRMKYGHHTTCSPVKETETGRVLITNQNVNYTVGRLSDELTVTYKNINDGETDGFRHKTLPVKGVQFYPQTENNPTDTGFLYTELLREIETGGKSNA